MYSDEQIIRFANHRGTTSVLMPYIAYSQYLLVIHAICRPSSFDGIKNIFETPSKGYGKYRANNVIATGFVELLDNGELDWNCEFIERNSRNFTEYFGLKECLKWKKVSNNRKKTNEVTI